MAGLKVDKNALFEGFKPHMSRVCELTGKKGQYGNTVSNANNRNRTKNFVNLRYKRFFVAETKAFVRVRLSNRAIRTVDKLGGLVQACRKNEGTLSLRLSKLLLRAKRASAKKATKKAA